jgi:hypothetical protein
MMKIALRREISPVNFAHQAFRALPSIFPFFMNSARNTQETADVQTEIGVEIHLNFAPFMADPTASREWREVKADLGCFIAPKRLKS